MSCAVSKQDHRIATNRSCLTQSLLCVRGVIKMLWNPNTHKSLVLNQNTQHTEGCACSGSLIKLSPHRTDRDETLDDVAMTGLCMPEQARTGKLGIPSYKLQRESMLKEGKARDTGRDQPGTVRYGTALYVMLCTLRACWMDGTSISAPSKGTGHCANLYIESTLSSTSTASSFGSRVTMHE